jgi:hypothetical protein
MVYDWVYLVSHCFADSQKEWHCWDSLRRPRLKRNGNGPSAKTSWKRTWFLQTSLGFVEWFRMILAYVRLISIGWFMFIHNLRKLLEICVWMKYNDLTATVEVWLVVGLTIKVYDGFLISVHKCTYHISQLMYVNVLYLHSFASGFWPWSTSKSSKVEVVLPIW